MKYIDSNRNWNGGGNVPGEGGDERKERWKFVLSPPLRNFQVGVGIFIEIQAEYYERSRAISPRWTED